MLTDAMLLRAQHYLEKAQMDNILKMVLGVLAFAGILVMVIPSGNPLAPQDRMAAIDIPPPAPADAAPPAASSASIDDKKEDKFAVKDKDIASFGQPMVDPTPLGQQQQAPANSQPNYPQISQMVQQNMQPTVNPNAAVPSNPNMAYPNMGTPNYPSAPEPLPMPQPAY
jgi:hypothetical protein